MNGDSHISFGLVLHNHQPAGQTGSVFEETYARCYEPLVGALERHPGVKIGLHYSGPLLDWLLEQRHDLVRRVRALVERGQVEMLTGGYYEPILPSIPTDDKRGQILKMTEAVKSEFGYNANGLWLAERVWEPALPTHLERAGVEWTILDSVHFEMAGLSDGDLAGYFMTEDNGHATKVFGSARRLRDSIPRRPVTDFLAFMREEAAPYEGKIRALGVEGERFGGWPDSYDYSWGRKGTGGWVEEFFSALEENAEWIHMVKLGDFVRAFPATGRIYLPTASYDEMMEWALPAERAREGAGSPALHFIHGGFWRNFLVKYPEINTQHKKMLRAHDKIAEARKVLEERGKPKSYGDVGQEDLWKGQSNDTYWHGLSGGAYNAGLRVSAQSHLISAQRAAERVLHGEGNWLRHDLTDFDRDSLQELLVESNALNLYIDLADGGSIFEWDLLARDYNLASTMSRRPEAYHEKLKEREAKGRAAAQRKVAKEGESEVVDAQSDETVRAEEKELARYLSYDEYRRSCMLDHFLGAGVTLDDFAASRYTEEGNFIDGPYQAEVQPGIEQTLSVSLVCEGHIESDRGRNAIRISKRLSLKAGTPDFHVLYTLENTGDDEISTIFGSEWNINLLGGGHNPSAYYRVMGQELEDAALDSTGEARKVTELALVNTGLGIEMGLRLSREATFWRFPIETISGSDESFERTYQGSCLLLQWPVKLAPDQSVDIGLSWEYRTPPQAQ